MFDACDIEGGPDGKISFDEIIKAADNTGVFVKETKVAQEKTEASTPEGNEEEAEPEVTLDDLRKVLEKVDVSGD